MSYYSSHRLRLAIRTLRQGGVIAYPTEAVYGLGCDPWNAAAVQRLLALKHRSVRKGLIVIAAEIAQLTPFLRQLACAQDAAMLASWPGPHTWLLPVRATTPRWLTGDFDTLAVRVTAHPLAAALCRHFGGAIVSTSANRAQRRPARTALQLRRALGQQPDYCLIGQCGSSRQPSTIRDGRSGQLVRGA